MARPSRICEADRPICPSCDRPIRKVLVVSGHYFAHCETRKPVGNRYEECGQHMHIVGNDGLCWVTALTKEEFKGLREHITTLTAREVYRVLGLLHTHDHSNRTTTS